MSFTLSDLTGREYSELARRIKGDPVLALQDPTSTARADTLAALLQIMDRRAGNPEPWENYRDLTMSTVLVRLGQIEDDSAMPSHAEALDAARDFTGVAELEDPTAARP